MWTVLIVSYNSRTHWQSSARSFASSAISRCRHFAACSVLNADSSDPLSVSMTGIDTELRRYGLTLPLSMLQGV